MPTDFLASSAVIHRDRNTSQMTDRDGILFVFAKKMFWKRTATAKRNRFVAIWGKKWTVLDVWLHCCERFHSVWSSVIALSLPDMELVGCLLLACLFFSHSPSSDGLKQNYDSAPPVLTVVIVSQVLTPYRRFCRFFQRLTVTGRRSNGLTVSPARPASTTPWEVNWIELIQ